MRRYTHTFVYAAMVMLFLGITWRLYEDNQRITQLATQRAEAAIAAEYGHCLQRNYTSAAVVRLIELIATSPTLPPERVAQYKALQASFVPEQCALPTKE